MAMYDYNELADSVANWTSRADLGELIPDFIRLAEVDISIDLKLQTLNKSHAITLVLEQTQYALPTDFMSIIRVADAENIAINQVSPESKDSGYYIENGYFVLSVKPIEVKTLTLYYIAKNIDIYNTGTNEILLKYPNVYLYSALSKAAEYIKDNERIQYWTAKYKADVIDANRAQNMKRKTVLTVDFK